MRMRLIVQLGLRDFAEVNAVRLTRQNGNGFHGASLRRKNGNGLFQSDGNEAQSVSNRAVAHYGRPFVCNLLCWIHLGFVFRPDWKSPFPFFLLSDAP